MRTTTRALGLALATTTIGVAACTRADDRGTATDRDGTVDSASAMSGATGAGMSANAMTQDTADDQSIAAVLATVDRYEIQSSRVALQKASSGDVKRYAQKMIDEHLRTSQQLAQLARNGNLMLPDSTNLDQQLGFGAGSGGASMSGGTGAGTTSGTGGGMSAGSGGSRANDMSGSARGTGGSPSSTGAVAGGMGNTSTQGGSNAAGSGSGSASGMSGGTTAATGNPVGTGSAASGSGRGEAMRTDSAGASSRGNATLSPNAILQELHRDAQQAMATLRPLRGAAFDRAYMDAQVAMHSKTLNALGNLSASARDQQLRAHIDMVTRHVQEHLQEGQQLRQRLGGGR